ncbi:rab effector MyRIP isoform X1 [Denticeps clupeoides]|uniref:rab effector MyRIP isoform X1 n=3 Tax=Denticeps clupeoides TaxID=299321 RepID=UPI0010A3A18D|nr:rab effector MyRIP-like isoform X1 [Denticeps clupeoides]
MCLFVLRISSNFTTIAIIPWGWDMGRKMDLSGLTEEEAQHILHVVQRDMRLRESEESRLSEMRQELDAEGTRCSLLSRQRRFNQRCCIHCCSTFAFLLNPKRACLDCGYNVCRRCRAYSRRDKSWLCSVCQKRRLLKTRSLDWYYNDVRRRFRRFGSAKVLKTLYRRHLAEQDFLTEFTGDELYDSTYEGSTGNEGSVSESDSIFYRHSNEHSMEETISVALRVAGEAVDEAISKAEAHADSQEKQSEAQYLRGNREKLVEDLATTILHKIIRRRRDTSEVQSECSLDQSRELLSLCPPPHSSLGPETSRRTSLWRSHSAFSLLTSEILDRHRGRKYSEGLTQAALQGLKTDGASALRSWKSADRLDHSGASSVLQSPDGNWIALQSAAAAAASRPRMLAQRKSQVFSALERESGVVSPYDELASDTGLETEDPWGGGVHEIQRRIASSRSQGSRGSPSPPGGEGARLAPYTLLVSLVDKSAPQEPRRTPLHRPSILNMNFNPEPEDSSGPDDVPEVHRSRRKRKGRKDEKQVPDYFSMVVSERSRTAPPRLGDQADAVTSGHVTPEPLVSWITGPVGPLELTSRLRELSCQDAASSTEEDLNMLDEEGTDEVGGTSGRHTPHTPAELGEETSGGSDVENSDYESEESSEGGSIEEILDEMVRASEAEIGGGTENVEIEGDTLDTDLEEDEETRLEDTDLLSHSEREMRRESESEEPEAPAELESVGTGQEMIEGMMDIRDMQFGGVTSVEEFEDRDITDNENESGEEDLEEEDLEELEGLGESGEEQSLLLSAETEGTEDSEKWSVEQKPCVEGTVVHREEVSEETRGADFHERVESGVGKDQRRGQAGPSMVEQGEEPSLTEESESELLEDGDGENMAHTGPQEPLSPGDICKKHSAASLCSITREVLRVLNATEDLIQEAEEDGPAGRTGSPALSPKDSGTLDQQLSRLEENVYIAAGSAFGLEAELNELEGSARRVSGATTEREMAFLEEQVASAAAQVQQSELQVADISSRIAALKNAGLNVAPQTRFSKLPKHKPKPQTIDSSRLQRRRLPAPPFKDSES